MLKPLNHVWDKGGSLPVAGEDVHLAMLVHVDLHGQAWRHLRSHMLNVNMARYVCAQSKPGSGTHACALSQPLICTTLFVAKRMTVSKPSTSLLRCTFAGTKTNPYAEPKVAASLPAGQNRSRGAARSLAKLRQAELGGSGQHLSALAVILVLHCEGLLVVLVQHLADAIGGLCQHGLDGQARAEADRLAYVLRSAAGMRWNFSPGLMDQCMAPAFVASL